MASSPSYPSLVAVQTLPLSLSSSASSWITRAMAGIIYRLEMNGILVCFRGWPSSSTSSDRTFVSWRRG